MVFQVFQRYGKCDFHPLAENKSMSANAEQSRQIQKNEGVGKPDLENNEHKDERSQSCLYSTYDRLWWSVISALGHKASSVAKSCTALNSFTLGTGHASLIAFSNLKGHLRPAYKRCLVWVHILGSAGRCRLGFAVEVETRAQCRVGGHVFGEKRQVGIGTKSSGLRRCISPSSVFLCAPRMIQSPFGRTVQRGTHGTNDSNDMQLGQEQVTVAALTWNLKP